MVPPPTAHHHIFGAKVIRMYKLRPSSLAVFSNCYKMKLLTSKSAAWKWFLSLFQWFLALSWNYFAVSTHSTLMQRAMISDRKQAIRLWIIFTHLQDLVGRVCLVAVQESVVDHVTRPLPIERQLHHLRRGGGGPLGETVQRNVFQQSVITNPTQQVDLNDRRQWRTRSDCKTLLEIWHWFIAYRRNRKKVFNYHSKESGLQNNMPLYPCVWLVCGRRKLESAAVVNCLNSINHLELHNTQVNFHNLPAVDWAAAMNHAFQSSGYWPRKLCSIPLGKTLYPRCLVWMGVNVGWRSEGVNLRPRTALATHLLYCI